MLNLYSTVEQLTSSTLSPRASIRLLNDFAAELGWKPSDHFIYNRTDPPTIVESRLISPDNLDSLRSEAFEQITGKRPNPNIPALDDALIKTISSWKRNLVAEMGEIGQSALNEVYSALF